MAIFQHHLNDLVDSVLTQIGLYSRNARELVIATIAHESQSGTYLKQLGKGPALGICQMEPATYRDIWTNFLAYRPDLAKRITMLMVNDKDPRNHPEEMVYNLALSIAMCRIKYLRDRAPLPDASDINGMAKAWKRIYNTAAGSGTIEEFIENYRNYCS